MAMTMLVGAGTANAEESVVGGAEVRARGGRVVIIPLTVGHSTTSTLEKVRGRIED